MDDEDDSSDACNAVGLLHVVAESYKPSDLPWTRTYCCHAKPEYIFVEHTVVDQCTQDAVELPIVVLERVVMT